MSLDRLIRLSQRTGDRLIVHNPFEQDVVVMTVDDYERIVDRLEYCDLMHPSNGDAVFSEQVAPDSADFDIPVQDISWDSDEDESWDSVGEVMEDRFGGEEERIDAQYFSYGDNGIDEAEDARAAHDFEPPVPPASATIETMEHYMPTGDHSPPDRPRHHHDQHARVDWVGDPEEHVGVPPQPAPQMTPAPGAESAFDQAGPEVQKVPIPHQPAEGQWEEEPLSSDEPVFYEEPV